MSDFIENIVIRFYNKIILMEDILIRLTFLDFDLAIQLFGEKGAYLKIIEDTLSVCIKSRNNVLHITGSDSGVDLSRIILEQLYKLLKKRYPIYFDDVVYAIKLLSENPKLNLEDVFLENIYIASKKKIIKPRNITQKNYIDAIKKFDIVFGIGPAGTGKTYLAMAMALFLFLKGDVSRIILTCPAVEAGETLGFLPGDFRDKVDPYLRPLYDALYDMMCVENVSSLIKQGLIEIAPIAFMRGRTLSNSFIIFDEAQNITKKQMKMCLTRIGINSKVVISGDNTQVDLKYGKISGLNEACEILHSVAGIKFIFFSKHDVVRHKLIKDIISAYEMLEN